MKKYLILLFAGFIALGVYAYDMYAPKDAAQNEPQFNNAPQIVKTEQTQQKREIMDLTEYFRYLPREVHRNWTPYESSMGYEVTVQFRVNRNGSIGDIKVIKSTNRFANASVINAVKLGAPYQPLPRSYKKSSVLAQVMLEYQRQ